MATSQDTGAHAGPKKPGGGLLWLWLLLGALVLVLVAYAVGAALNDDDELEGGVPVGTERAEEAFFVGHGKTVMVRSPDVAGEQATEPYFAVEEGGDAASFTGTLQAIDEALLSELQLYDPAEELETGEVYVQAETSPVLADPMRTVAAPGSGHGRG